ncbi:MAG: 5-(carboxyamino)imidazole ribonucleotide mutase [Candidatus Omnitrophota bacterium]|nr:5-(carboxyamino)imidazole ribonucleotide mutase [Candidatus Omnitrophota bacterium]
MKKPVVSVVMGSKSDSEVVEECLGILKDFAISYEVMVRSAHRMPEKTRAFARSAARRGIKVIIACAGGAAHLAGVLASQTILPVIGIPAKTSALKGIDSYLSTLQMPAGVPVATVSIGKSGAKNAALLAAQILAINDSNLKKKLTLYKRKLAG